MSGGGKVLGDVGGYVSGSMTGGAFNTNGGGWAQGGTIKSGLTGGNKNGKGGLEGIVGMTGLGSEDLDVPGAMNRPTFDLGANGKLRDDLMLGNSMPASFDQSQAVLNKLQSNAMAVGPSQSAQYLQQANDRNTANSMGNADAQGRSSMANIMGQMAMRGGSDAGSRERIGKSGGFETMMNKQKIMNDAGGNNLNILADDEKQKQATLQALPSSLLAQAGMQQNSKQFDIGNTLNTFGNKYDKDMSIYGGNQSAREQAQLANKNKGLLGLGVAGL